MCLTASLACKSAELGPESTSADGSTGGAREPATLADPPVAPQIVAPPNDEVPAHAARFDPEKVARDAGLLDDPEPGYKPARGVYQAKPTVGPGLVPSVVRRVVRLHIEELRHCYDAGLKRAPTLGGRVTFEFEIDAKGAVEHSSVKSSELEPKDDQLEACLAKAVERWRFVPPRGHASVSVALPLVFEPGQSG